MPKLSDKPLRAVLIRLFDEDYEKLKAFYRRRSGNDGNLGVNGAVRQIVHAFLKQTEAEIERQIDEQEALTP